KGGDPESLAQAVLLAQSFPDDVEIRQRIGVVAHTPPTVVTLLEEGDRSLEEVTGSTNARSCFDKVLDPKSWTKPGTEPKASQRKHARLGLARAFAREDNWKKVKELLSHPDLQTSGSDEEGRNYALASYADLLERTQKPGYKPPPSGRDLYTLILK